jgi:hypothetical protein
LAVATSIGNYNAEAGMLARWLGLGSWIGGVSNTSSLNTSAALVNHSAFGVANDSGTYVGNNQLSNNSVGASGIGASSDGFLTAGDSKSDANIDDKVNANIQRKDLGVTTQNKSSITPPPRILSRNTIGRKSKALNSETEYVLVNITKNPESIIMSGWGLVPARLEKNVSSCEKEWEKELEKASAKMLIDPEVYRTEGWGDWTVWREITPRPQDTRIDEYWVFTINPDLGTMGRRIILEHGGGETAGETTLSGDLMVITGLPSPQVDIQIVDMTAVSVTYSLTAGGAPAVIKFVERVDNKGWDASAYANITDIPACGAGAMCIRQYGGHTLDYNPLCTSGVTWDEVHQGLEEAMRKRVQTAKPTPEAAIIPSPMPTQPLKWDAWKCSTIGVSAIAVVIGGTVVGLLIKRHIRNKNEIQIELIDDPALTHTLLQN